jgi:hypothetical protein
VLRGSRCADVERAASSEACDERLGGPPPDEKRGLPMAPELSRAPLATRAVRVNELPTTS